MTRLENLAAQCEELLSAARADVAAKAAEYAAAKADLAQLKRAYNALAKTTGNSQLTRKTRGAVSDKVIKFLEASPTAVDLGSVARTLYGEDNARHRSAAGAALAKLSKGPDSPVRRLGSGFYILREREETNA